MSFFSKINKFFTREQSKEEPVEVVANQGSASALLGEGASFDSQSMTLALRSAEPKLSSWLQVVLEGVSTLDAEFWGRIRFLLKALDQSDSQVDSFCDSFASWCREMEYTELSEFRSELQYRLSILLELEDEESESNFLLEKFSEGLAKTRAHLVVGLHKVFSPGRELNAALWEELEETLFMADMSYSVVSDLIESLKQQAIQKKISNPEELRDILREEIIKIFKPVRRIEVSVPPEVVLVVGVNGVGKTTTIAKLANKAIAQGKKVLLVGADTFRAAAVEQLGIWAQRSGAGFYAKEQGADPASVAFEAMDKALKEEYDIVYIDTAGRLHTKANLMEELAKIERVLSKKHAGAPHKTILVLDASTGQNALSQIKTFNELTKLDELIFTKLDGTAKGGIAVSAAKEFNIPISYVGFGEKIEDLRAFSVEHYVQALLG